MPRLSPWILRVVGCLTIAFHADAAASTLPHLWSQRFGDANAQSAYAVATDASGNVIVTGSFSGTVNFGVGNLTSAGSEDVFVAKFNSAGVLQWSKRFGDASLQRAYCVATDGNGNVIIAGSFNGTINFGGGDLTSVGGVDIFLAKFNSAGVHQWSQQFGDEADQFAYSVATDGNGNVILTGAFWGVISFGGPIMIAGQFDIFLVKFNAAGADLWSKRFGDVQNQYAYSVATDASGNIVVTGAFYGTITFGGGFLNAAPGFPNTDIFIVKFDSTGLHQWSGRFGDGFDQFAYSLATDASGDVIVTGYFSGTVNFGGEDLTSAGSVDIFVAKFNSAGAHQWSQRFGDANQQYAYSVATDGSGNVVVTGYFAGTVNFGGEVLASAGSSDLFVAKFNPSGVLEWSQRFGDEYDQVANSAATDGRGNVIVTGSFAGTVNFGGGYLPSAGNHDVFVAKFGSVAEPTITSIADIGNDQGRRVRIRFDRSGADDEAASIPVTGYVAFRRDDTPPAASLPSRSPLDVGWTEAGSVSAFTKDSYGIDVPTIGDSTIALGEYNSVFFIRAATDAPSVFYDSTPDSGHSIDNLAPGVPTTFAYTAGTLTWDESTSDDFDYFSVYGGSTESFGSATLVDYTVDPAMNVNLSPYTFYFVTATDFSGNEGMPEMVNALSGTGRAPENYVLSISSYPNPFNPGTTIRYTVPSRSWVEVAVYDAQGRRVATLEDSNKNAGAYTLAWNGIDTRGNRASSGVYFARITHSSGTRSYKLVLLK